jgi:hypothetical protein
MEASYLKRVVKKGVSDTIEFFGWNKRTLVVPFLWLIGAGIHWGLAGWEAVASELIIALVYGLIPVVGFAILLLLYNLMSAPARLQAAADTRIHQLAESIEKIRNKQDKVDHLSELLSEGIQEIWNREVSNDRQLQELDDYWMDWRKRILSYLDEHFTKSDVAHFGRLGVVHLVGRTDAYNERHAKILREYALQEQRLREIIRDHNVTHI